MRFVEASPKVSALGRYVSPWRSLRGFRALHGRSRHSLQGGRRRRLKSCQLDQIGPGNSRESPGPFSCTMYRGSKTEFSAEARGWDGLSSVSCPSDVVSRPGIPESVFAVSARRVETIAEPDAALQTARLRRSQEAAPERCIDRCCPTSLRYSERSCDLTVLSETERCFEMSATVRWSTIACSTIPSRGVSGVDVLGVGGNVEKARSCESTEGRERNNCSRSTRGTDVRGVLTPCSSMIRTARSVSVSALAVSPARSAADAPRMAYVCLSRGPCAGLSPVAARPADRLRSPSASSRRARESWKWRERFRGVRDRTCLAVPVRP